MGLTVGVTRDERFAEHKTGHFHPEHPRRILELYRMIDREFGEDLIQFRPEPAAMEDMERVHTQAHIRKILKTAEQHITSLAPDTPASARSYMAAWLAAGACMQGVDLLADNRCDAFFALVRPPGHHALPDRPAGFCIFNNIAVAARYALARRGMNRVFIVDWDVHHGNGLNDIFYEDENVYYYSTHDLMLYPYSGEPEQTGAGKALGYTMNIPISRHFRDNDMVHVYRETLLPAVRGFCPDMVMVAAGFDGHSHDPIGRNRFSEDLYTRLIRLILAVCRERENNTPLFLALEGGYDTLALAGCVKGVLRELVRGRTDISQNQGEPSQEAEDLVRQIRKIHQPYGVMQ
ncbi:MAG: histone deacetylase [Desulfobacteraceae bacterium]|nr:histone deacetylase [Desulfobacteraceae bacterium]MCF8094699.1 histone deacetylase [Desulfobacteraceae bacterium]